LASADSHPVSPPHVESCVRAAIAPSGVCLVQQGCHSRPNASAMSLTWIFRSESAMRRFSDLIVERVCSRDTSRRMDRPAAAADVACRTFTPLRHTAVHPHGAGAFVVLCMLPHTTGFHQWCLFNCAHRHPIVHTATISSLRPMICGFSGSPNIETRDSTRPVPSVL
jgi:hypothetical protein